MQSKLFANRVELVCQHCGKTYRQKPARVPGAKYCSRRCLSRANKEQARQRRIEQGGTLPERLVRTALDELGLFYVPEQPMGAYTIDFYLPDHRIALEVDGAYWHSLNPHRDQRRDESLTLLGIRTVRISDKPLLKSADVSALIRSVIGI
jgi:very-short-patch-repair endonuclease